MRKLYALTTFSIILFVCEISYSQAQIELSNINKTCIYADQDHHIGTMSNAEEVLTSEYLRSPCGTMPTMDDRYWLYTRIKTGEVNQTELSLILQRHCDNHTVDWNPVPWADRMPGKVYAWTVDFHPAPAACNFPLYKEIGVVLHAEVDHHPYCEFNGVCASRLKSVFGLGKRMVGFSLDPDHTVLKRDFYEAYKDDPEFKRVDVFMCSHPASNCELFEAFKKPMITYFTTRFEFGRNDQNISWRRSEINAWNAAAELPERQRNWTQFVINYSQQGLLGLAANSLYDVKYVEYLTGRTPEYIRSWCGDLDGSYGRRKSWTGCLLPDTQAYHPVIQTTLIVPYKQTLWARGGEINVEHGMYVDFAKAFTSFRFRHPDTPEPSIKHSLHAITDHSPETYKKYKALIFIPYQSSCMSFFEFYRQNIPMFAPSVELYIEWHQKYGLASGRIYGTPKREVDLIEAATGGPVNTSIPDPNDNNDLRSNQFWFPFFDLYQFEHIQLFDSWDHLLDMLSPVSESYVDLAAVSRNMATTNAADREKEKRQWTSMFKRLVPHRFQ